MGHMLNNTLQDVLVRRARMLGKNACWVPGTDHASIATEAKVVQKLKLEGIQKSDLTREQFLEHAFEWKEKHGGIILGQLKKLGASCDWERTTFTIGCGLFFVGDSSFCGPFRKRTDLSRGANGQLGPRSTYGRLRRRSALQRSEFSVVLCAVQN